MRSRTADALAYFDVVDAVAHVGPPFACARRFHIGGSTVELRSSQPAFLDNLTGALDHLAAPSSRGPAQLTVDVWAGSPQPPAPWAWSGRPAPTAHFDPERELAEVNDERIRTALDLYPSRLQLLDLVRQRAFWWIEDADALPYYEQGAPLRRLLGGWMAALGCHTMHAGAVGTAAGAVLLAGPSGAGKSTAALACLESPLSYLGDDYVLVSTAPEPRVYSLYNTAKLKGAADLRRFPQLAPFVHNAGRLDQEKAMVFVHGHWPHKLIRDAPLRAILIPNVTGARHARLVPISASEALVACAPSTLTQLRVRSQTAFQQMAQLVQRLPCYRLETGPNLASIPAVILELLAR